MAIRHGKRVLYRGIEEKRVSKNMRKKNSAIQQSLTGTPMKGKGKEGEKTKKYKSW